MIDRTIAHYEIKSQLGQGGMGEVYRATDTKLKRDVALKILPESLAREEGTHAIAMELVEGETLATRVARGPVPLEEASRRQASSR